MCDYEGLLADAASWINNFALLFEHIFRHGDARTPSEYATPATGWRPISTCSASSDMKVSKNFRI